MHTAVSAANKWPFFFTAVSVALWCSASGYGAIALLYHLLLLMTHHEKTRLKAPP